MGGTIDVKSKIGKGTVFNIYLPFDAATKEETDAVYLRKVYDGTHKTESLNVLIAEDNEVNALIARAFLEKFGHNVQHVENGKLAVEAAKDGWADLILMDVHMPEMNGIDATKAIRLTELGSALPIIGLTAEAFAERHLLFIEAGMNDVVTKPYTEMQLADTLATHRLIERRSHPRPEGVNDTFNVSGEKQGSSDDNDQIDTVEKTESHSLDVKPAIGDKDKLNSLREQIGSETISVLLRKTQTSLQTNMEELLRGVVDNNTEQIREAAHSIKGASGTMFVMLVSELAAEIQESSKNVDVVHSLMPKFESTVKEALEWWQKQEIEVLNSHHPDV